MKNIVMVHVKQFEYYIRFFKDDARMYRYVLEGLKDNATGFDTEDEAEEAAKIIFKKYPYHTILKFKSWK